MKTKRVLLLMVLSATVYVQSLAQVIGRQNVDQYPITAWNTMTYGLTYLPPDYNSTTTKYPLIIFLHGSGEGGDGVGGLWNLLVYGLPNKIANGFDPAAVNPVDGQNYKFIVVSPQAPSAAHWSYAWGSVQWVLKDVINRYRIDTTRVYVTGISAGGAGTWSCVTNGPEAAKKFPAIVPVSSAGTNSPQEAAEIPLVGGTYGSKVWSVTGISDAWLAFAQNATNSINTAIPPPIVPAILTAVPGGHDPGAWNTPYDPNWRNNSENLNIYEWMLKYQRVTNAPSANAGSNQTITLPLNQVTLSGTGTPGSGNTITTYAWTKISGPASYSINSPGTASTLVTGLTQGTYIFRLTVTDNLNATASADVSITVNPLPNILPLASAGADQVINFPLNAVTLNGSGTDADGTIASYQWTKISGPAQFNLVSPTTPATAFNNLVSGIYQLELRVTDNLGGIGKDTVNITVVPPPNSAPSAFAGSDQTITLPGNSVILNGSGTDTDGTIASYQWNKISGPAQFNIVTANQSQTTVNNLAQGTYKFELVVTDNLGATGKDTVSVQVNPAPNQLPVANAGANQTITLPTNTVSLNGIGTDADGTIASYQWNKISGPATFNIVAANQAITSVNNLVQGTYQFELVVTDNLGAIGKDTVSVQVNPAPNQLPFANAGTNQTITLPTNTGSLNGSGTDADGTIASYQWNKINGPATFNIVAANQAITSVNNLVQGTYQFELVVTDNQGAIGKDTVSVQVNPAPNQLPVANAGTNQTITLPTNTVSLNGSGTDADGTIASYQWNKISGPATFNIVAANQAITSVNNLVQGTYQFEFIVTDNVGAIAKDSMTVTVNAAVPPPNQLPVANAGTNQTITLPINSANLNGSGTDADGTIASYQWNKISGPATFNIVAANQAITSVNNLVQGTYQFELVVTDNLGAIAKDSMTVTVNAAVPPPNQLPVANAGTDQVITLPVDSILLSGSGTDADGTIASYQWNKISGPASFNIVAANQAISSVNNLVQGTYQFELIVTDNLGAIARDSVTVTVNAAIPNLPPVANAGSDQVITLPVDSIALNGSGTDSDGNIISYSWTKISGPAQFLIANNSQAQTLVNQLTQGIYQFELTVTDNGSAVSRDTVMITVNSAGNIPPTVNAGIDSTITLPVNSILLTGSGNDADGSILNYSWSKVSGPVQYNIVSPTQAQTVVNNLAQGIYLFELMVTDSLGAIARDTVTITVNPDASVTLCNGVKKYIVPGGDGGRFYSAMDTTSIWYTPIHPGDTLVLRSQYSWNYFSLESYSGTAACPIVIMNEGGQVWMTAGIELKSCKYMKVTGSGDANTYYGFKIYNPGNDGSGVALSIQGKSKVIEIERADVYKKTYGVWAKQDPVCDQSFNYPNYVMDSIEIHHSRFKNIGQDCIYAGNTDPLGLRDTWCNGVVQHFIPMRLSNINIHHLVIDSCNRTGIQLSGADQGYNQIHNNTITNCGYEYNQQQGTAISIGGMTKNCHVYNNTIKNTFLYGILSFGAGVNYIENNTIDSSGYLDGIANTISRPTNIFASPKNTIPFDSTTVIIRFNKMGVNATTTNDNLALVVWGPPTWTQNNVVCSNTKLDGTTPASLSIAPTIHYINDCSVALPDMPPTAYAGNDISLNPPVNNTVLTGSGSDPDGTIITYHWTKIGGPSQFTIANPDSAQTAISNLVLGVYTFRLTVMDNDSLIATDDIQVRVAPPNVQPIANAGPNQIVTLPVNTTTLNGSAIDPDGTITSYLWTKISGPGTIQIVNAASPVTQVNNLVQGSYQFELRVTDNNGATGKDTVTVTVNPAPPPTNIKPVANAGPDQVITLPTDAAYLAGSASDPDGSIASVSWTKISGPIPYYFSNASTAQTTVGNLIQGTYQFVLTVTDNQGATGKDTVTVTVNPAPNVLPVAHAGNDQVITLPVNSVTLTGSGTDADGVITSYLWTKISGPASFAITSAAQPQTSVTTLVQGVYLFELRVADNNGAIARDTVRVTVNAAIPNIPPVANAGNDQVITLPVNTVSLSGSGTDADGTIASYLWTKISGPASFAISSASQSQTSVTNLTQGVYLFELQVTDNNGAIGRDTVRVTVNAAIPNLSPIVNAGLDQVITLPVNSVTLNGSATDPDGTIASYLWTKISGPVPFIIANAANAQTVILGLSEGVYQFELRATDNLGAISRDTVSVVVNAALPNPVNLAPVAHAGPDQAITLPLNSVSFSGSGTDADGTITAYSWTKISGPALFNIVSPAQAQTSVNNLVQGVYQFELKVTDNQGAVGRDTVTVAVNAPLTYSTAMLYPNPASNVINVKIDAVTHMNQTNIRIYDPRGALVYNELFMRTQQVVVKTIDVSKLLPGAYLVVLGVDINREVTLKFIKE